MIEVAMMRLPWVVDFDRCVFAVERHGERVCWVRARASEGVIYGTCSSLSDGEKVLIERVFEIGAPAAEPSTTIAVPIHVNRRTIGVILMSSEEAVYSYRDLRLCHHAGQYLGSLIARLELEDDARRQSNRKDELLALLAHELRNPLAPIMTAVQLLKTRDGPPTSREVEVIDRQARHLVRLLDDLLDVARLTRGKLLLERRPLEVAEVVALAVEIVGPLLEQRRHSLAIDVTDSGLVVDGDLSRLAQVVANLLSNAAHYTSPQGHLAIAARKDGQTAVIDVSDDGVGVATDSLSEIFDSFVQGKNRGGTQGGLGLGLVVVKQLTELHGGAVSVCNHRGRRGATFTIRLPCLPDEALPRRPAAGSVPPPRPSASRRILLVDDNVDALELLATFLASQGHEIGVARDGVEALALLEEFEPSVAVLDITMPVMGGYELAERIRARGGNNQPYLVALTGYGQAIDRERTRAAGFDQHLVKPVEHAALLRVIAGTDTDEAPSLGASPVAR
ncbi:MAG TPA: ATP-binding protein [Polyangiaceae bacterium]|nr:ATP-binding protein [Polyangiaceae bacterium]